MNTQLQKGLCDSRETALHTHDSICFKRCRRQWFFSSAFSLHLQPKPSAVGVNSNLWFGSGFHWAMQDYFGYNKFGDPVDAFMAYVEAHKPEELPCDVDDLVPLGVEMLSNYRDWQAEHSAWKVVWLDNKPLVEVPFSLVLEEASYYELDGDRFFIVEDDGSYRSARYYDKVYSKEQLIGLGAKYQEVVFHGKLDAIVEDQYGHWWILDYKTAAQFDTAKLSLDPQISKYCWAAEQYLEHPIEGMVYVQVSKTPPKTPKITSKGVSTDQRQRVTHKGYRQALKDYYGEVSNAPAACIQFLNTLADQEDEHGNKFIRYDWVERNDAMKINTYKNMILEARDMLHPDLRIYPNPSYECDRLKCPFKPMCLAMEEGADWQFYLDDYEVRNETMKNERPTWELRMIKAHPELFTEDLAELKESVDDIDEFMKKYE